MPQQKLITGNTEDEIWEQLAIDLAAEDELLDYNATIEQGNHQVILNIDIDLGGGFESGYETTTLIAALQTTNDFQFAIHKEDLLNEIGKFFGMQDLVIGYPEFDKNVIVKANNVARVKEVFSDKETRDVFESLSGDFTLGITTRDGKRVLEFTIEKGITDPHLLRKLYHAFYTILVIVDAG